MIRFASGPRPHYYGKGDVIVYRLNRDGNAPAGQSPVFGASVLMLLYGDAFWPTYATGDNTALIATDSIKNFIQRATMDFEGYDLVGFCRFLGERFLERYPQVEGLQVSAVEVPHARIGSTPAFTPGGPERATAAIELRRTGVIDATSGIEGFKLLRLGGSSFEGFLRDEYTTLPDLKNRPLRMCLDVEWSYVEPGAALNLGAVTAGVRQTVRDLFASFESGSIQQVIYQMGTRLLDDHRTMAEVRLEATNRTWDTIAEKGGTLGVYTEARPPYGCLGLTLKRS